MSMETHRHWLSVLCRTCGNKATDRAKSKTDYTYQIKSVYNIDIVGDNDDVHPRKVCCKCRLRLERYQEHAKKETFAPRLPTAPQFIPHSTSSDCWVCQSGKSGRPKKSHKRKSVASAAASKETDLDQLPPKVPCPESPETSTSTTIQQPASPEPLPSTSALKMELFSEETEVLPAEAYMQKIKADYSIPVERFVDPGIAASFVCKVCNSMSCNNICQCLCGHRFCRPCVESWLVNASTCPVCMTCLEHSDIHELKGDSLYRFEEQQVHCTYQSSGCKKSCISETCVNMKLHASINTQRRFWGNLKSHWFPWISSMSNEKGYLK